MRKLIPILALATLVASMAPADVGASFLYNLSDRSCQPAITKDVGKLTAVFGRKGLDFDALALVSSTPTNAPVFGYALVSRYRLANEASLTFGPALTAAQGQKMSFGVLVGVSFRF